MYTQKLFITAFSVVFLIFSMSCSNAVNEARVLNSTTTSQEDSNPYAPQASFGMTGEGNLASLLDPVYWYNGAVPDVPQCGPEKVNSSCLAPSSEDEMAACRALSATVQRNNLALGYYFVRVDEVPFCEKKCTPSAPSCNGSLLKCAGDAASYLGKKVLQHTQACIGVCLRAVRRGLEFPYECKNLRDNQDFKDLSAKIEAEQKKLSSSPQVQEKIKELVAITAEREKIRLETAAAEKAEAEFPNWVKTEYDPKLRSLVSDLQATDNKILAILAELAQDTKTVQSAIFAVIEDLQKQVLTPAKIEEHSKKFAEIKGLACKAYELRFLVDSGRKTEAEIHEVNNQLIKKSEEIRNIHFITKTKEDVKNFHNKVSLTHVHADLINGTMARETCANYRKYLAVLGLSKALQTVATDRENIQGLMAILDKSIQEIEGYKTALEFQENLRAKAFALAKSLVDAKTEARWNRGNRIAGEAAKLLYLVFILAVELNPDLLPASKPILVDSLKKIMEPAIVGWNIQSQALGVKTMVLARRAKVQRKLDSLMVSLNQPGQAAFALQNAKNKLAQGNAIF